MYLPQQKQISKNRNYINAFGGYNHQARISDSEFYDMRNMTADNYPVLSVRDARNYKLKVASNEFEPVELTIEQQYIEESLSKRYAIYTLTFEVAENNTYELEYTVDDTYVAEYEQKIVFIKNDRQINYKTPSAMSFIVPEGCTEAVITITANWNQDTEKWKEENLSAFIYGFTVNRHNETIRGMLLKNGKLAYLIENTLYWNDHKFDFSNYADQKQEQQLISYGAYILIFPMGVYVNTNDASDYGYLGASYETTENVSYSMCNLDGAEYSYTLAETAPEEPEDGQYWMKKYAEGDALYQWSETMAMWTAVSTTYIKIKVSGNKDCFSVFELQDAIFIENSSVEALNGINTIAAMGTIEENGTTSSYIVITGILDETVQQTSSVRFERKVPTMDYTCVSGNRVWGCYYGPTEEGTVNEIYACKLGDPKNWYSYQGTAQDSYALSMGDDGEFTGAYTYQGYPLFFKENNIYKIYGTYPAAYQLITYDCRGVQKGSSKGIAIVDEYLVYKSINDICVFDGNYPVTLSDKLGKRSFSNCAAGAYMSKYYASMKDDQTGEYAIYVYDFKTNLWMRDEKMEIVEFISTKSGELYGRTKVGIISFGNENDTLGLQTVSGAAETVEWFAETGNYGFDSPDKKMITNIKIRAAIHFGARMKLEVYYDDAGKWREHWIDKGGMNSDGKIRSFEVPILPVNCDTMRMRLSGIGKVEIFSIAKKVEDGGQ